MINKIGFLHTGVAIADLFKPMIARMLPGKSTFHIVDDSLIQDLLAVGEFTPGILKRLCNQVTLAEEAGADLIMVTCSSIAPGVNLARDMVGVPVMKVDEPMAQKAVQTSGRIGLLATAKTTMAPSAQLIEDTAKQMGKKITLHRHLEAGAFECFLRGDMEAHDKILLAKAGELKGKVGVIVLAQVSMSHLQEQIAGITGVPVLISPPLAMEALVKRVEQG
jgi:Asp/Glu/hydantoin racemase